MTGIETKSRATILYNYFKSRVEPLSVLRGRFNFSCFGILRQDKNFQSANELAIRAGAPLFDGMDNHHHAITTSDGEVVMADEDRVRAYAAIQQSLALKKNVSQKEGDFIGALATRYNGDITTPRGALDFAYVDSMRTLYENYSDDDDVASLFAESMMYGLIQSLQVQDKNASDIQAKFDIIWAQSDIILTASRF